MAPESRGRAILSKANARPRKERLGRLLNPESKRTSESLQAAVRRINRRFGPSTVVWAADLIAERPR
jgi:hypothetical protein